MSTTVVQEEQKYLSIDELMPTWAAYFDLLVKNRLEEAEQFKTLNNINIGNSNKCCVGESWKWKNIYKRICTTCDSFAFYGTKGDNGFLHLEAHINAGRITTEWRETPIVREFVEHFNEKHIN